MSNTRQSTLTSRQQKAANAAARKAAKAEGGEGSVPKACTCECGGFTVNPKASFISGHDAILKGRLLREFDGGSEEAGARLIGLGWYTNDTLEARAVKREQEVQDKADRAKAREEKAALNRKAKEDAKAARTKTATKAQTQPVQAAA